METRQGHQGKQNTRSTKNGRGSPARKSMDYRGTETRSASKQNTSSKKNELSPPATRRSARVKDRAESSNKKSKSPSSNKKAVARGRSQGKEQQKVSSAKKTGKSKSPARSSSKKKAPENRRTSKETTPVKNSRTNSPHSTKRSTKNRKSKRKASHISPANKSNSKSPKSVGQTRRKSELKKTKLSKQEEEKEDDAEIKINLPKKRLSAAAQKEEEDYNPETEVHTKKKVSGVKKKMDTEEVRRVNPRSMTVFDLNIQIKGSKFYIFRNVYITDKIQMTKLARIIVASMGWLGYWDWTFRINNNVVVCPPDDDDLREKSTIGRYYGDEIKLESFNLKVGDKFEFIYNTRAPWIHEIVIEGLENIDLHQNGNPQDVENAKVVQHAVVSIGNLAVPSDAITQQEYEQIWEDYENGEKEFSKWKKKLGETFDPTKFEKNKVNDSLKIHLYDESKIDPKVKESDSIFKW